MSKELLASPFRSAAERQQERTVKRQALLTAAARLFNERGFHATSLDDLAASLGVTKPVIYHYLGTKDQVLLECVRVGLNQLQEAADEASRGGGDGLTQLKRCLVRYAEVNMGDFGRCVILTGDAALSAESRREFRQLKRKIDQKVRALVDNAIADRSIKPVDVRMATFTIAGALNWPAYWYSPEGEKSPAEIAASMVELLVGGLLPPTSKGEKASRER
jgi:AcrR family transcriptional regulator